MSPPWQKQCAEAQRSYSRADLRLIPSEHWHMTIVFFGDVATAQLLVLRDILLTTMAAVPSCPLEFERLEFKDSGRDYMLWARFFSTSAFAAMVEKIRQAVAPPPLALPVETRPQIPHITLARGRTHVALTLPQQPTWSLTTLEITRLHLYESKRDQLGSRYEIIQSYDLFTPTATV